MGGLPLGRLGLSMSDILPVQIILDKPLDGLYSVRTVIKRTGESQMTKELKAARAKVNSLKFGTKEWEAAMEVVRVICAKIDAAKPREEFCSVDSGFHRTRLSNGRVIG